MRDSHWTVYGSGPKAGIMTVIWNGRAIDGHARECVAPGTRRYVHVLGEEGRILKKTADQLVSND